MIKSTNALFNFDGINVLTASNKHRETRILMVNQLIKLIIAGLLISSMVDALLGIYDEAVITLVTMLLYVFILLYVDKSKYYNTVVTMSVFLLCSLIFYSDGKSGYEAGVFILFLPTAFAISFVTRFDSYHFILHFGIPASYLILSIITDHTLFLDPAINSFQKKIILVFNLSLSAILFGLFIYYINRMNNNYEKGLGKAIQKLKSKNKEQINLNHQLDQLLAGVSHELREPRASVLTLMRMTGEEKDPDKIAQYMSIEEKSLIRVNEFIEDIIDYSRNFNLTLKKELIDFKQVIQEILDQYNNQQGFSSVKTYLNVEQKDKFMSDKKRIRVIMNNLIGNAFKHHDYEKPEPYIKINVAVFNRVAKIMVKDNGKGIHKKNINRVFEMFYRVNDKISGYGLGLYLVKEMVEKLGGKIRVSSTLNQESSFQIELPDLS